MIRFLQTPGILRKVILGGAMLFAGADGVGKKTLALMLAKALVCEEIGCARCLDGVRHAAACRGAAGRARAGSRF